MATLESTAMMASSSAAPTVSEGAVSIKACGTDVRISEMSQKMEAPLRGPSPSSTDAGLSTAIVPVALVAEEGWKDVDHRRHAGRDAPLSC
jgi:hypothetical protein